MADKTPLSEEELETVAGGVIWYKGEILDGTKTIAQLGAELGLTETEGFKKIESYVLNYTLNTIEAFKGTTWTQNWVNENFVT